MKTIETTISVNPDRTATLRVPDDISPGEHLAVVVVDQNEKTPRSLKPIEIPVDDVGPWPPGYLVNREDIYDDDP
jgi:hypothetical protein